jgi:mRNA interferase YafQ
MRKIEWTAAFKRDFKRCGALEAPLIEALWKLANDEPLPERFCDHALSGEWKDFRDCHIKPDWVLIYRDATFFLGRGIVIPALGGLPA